MQLATFWKEPKVRIFNWKKRRVYDTTPHHILISFEFFCNISYCIGVINPEVHSSQLSLGEIVDDEGMHPSSLPHARLSVDFDGISPISAQELCNNDSKLVRETKKLIRAVKQEDAYGIVCALKRGANPCLFINDVSTLHLAVGLKSDQRCSIVSINDFHKPDLIWLRQTLFKGVLATLVKVKGYSYHGTEGLSYTPCQQTVEVNVFEKFYIQQTYIFSANKPKFSFQHWALHFNFGSGSKRLVPSTRIFTSVPSRFPISWSTPMM